MKITISGVLETSFLIQEDFLGFIQKKIETKGKDRFENIVLQCHFNVFCSSWEFVLEAKFCFESYTFVAIKCYVFKTNQIFLHRLLKIDMFDRKYKKVVKV